MSTEESPEATARRMQQTQAKVDEVVDIMRVNVEKVLDRDKKISDLDNRAEVLAQGASQFEQQTGRLKRKYWWQNLKMLLILGLVAAVILIIIIVWIATEVGGGSDASDTTTTKPTVMDSTTRT